MATQTLGVKYEIEDDSVSRNGVILCREKHTKEVYYQFDNEVATEYP
jgi:hypothetical protein